MKLGIIGAMEVEVEHLRSRMSECRHSIVAGMEFDEGLIGDASVVIAFCKVGKVNAAVCVQVLADRFGVTHVVNTGVGGSLDARIDINDLVVSMDAVHHDMDVANLGYALGQVPGMDTLSFAADADLRAKAVAAAREVAPEIGVHEGRIASGDQFVRDDALKHRIAAEFGALCCEMEGAAIAHACYLNGIPFVIVRAISDKADGSDAMSYDEFERVAAEHCARIVEHMVQML